MPTATLNRSEANVQQPKHAVLAGRIRRQMRAGDLLPGDRLPSYAQMRAEFGVSQDVLDRMHRTLEQEGLVVREARRGIFVAPKKAPVARTGVIGFAGVGGSALGAEYSAPMLAYWSPLVEGIQQAAAQSGLELLLLNANSELRPEKMDGVLLSEYNPETLHRLPPEMPRVSLIVETAEAPYVGADNYQGARDITRHFIELGHRRIAFFSFDLLTASQQRLRGYRAALEEAGIAFDPRLVRNVIRENPMINHETRGHFNMELWLADDWEALAPTALFAHNDHMALGAIKTLRGAGYGVPRDVSVAGFDGIESNDVARAHLTTACVPLREIGARGVELLQAQIQETAIKPQTLLPAPLSVGKTSATASVESR